MPLARKRRGHPTGLLSYVSCWLGEVEVSRGTRRDNRELAWWKGTGLGVIFEGRAWLTWVLESEGTCKWAWMHGKMTTDPEVQSTCRRLEE